MNAKSTSKPATAKKSVADTASGATQEVGKTTTASTAAEDKKTAAAQSQQQAEAVTDAEHSIRVLQQVRYGGVTIAQAKPSRMSIKVPMTNWMTWARSTRV